TRPADRGLAPAARRVEAGHDLAARAARQRQRHPCRAPPRGGAPDPARFRPTARLTAGPTHTSLHTNRLHRYVSTPMSTRPRPHSWVGEEKTDVQDAPVAHRPGGRRPPCAAARQRLARKSVVEGKTRGLGGA